MKNNISFIIFMIIIKMLDNKIIRPIRRVHKPNQYRYYERYNYMCIFKKVERNIKNFIHETLDPELYPSLQISINEILNNWKDTIFDRYMQYIDPIHLARLHNHFNDETFGNIIVEKAINMIGFTIWYGYKFKFPKKLKKDNFSKKRCIYFIDTAKLFCHNLINTLNVLQNFRNRKYLLFILHKIAFIFE